MTIHGYSLTSVLTPLIILVILLATPQLQVEFVGGRGGGVVEGGDGEDGGVETSSVTDTTHLNTSFHYVNLDISKQINLNPRLFFLLFDRKFNTTEPA